VGKAGSKKQGEKEETFHGAALGREREFSHITEGRAGSSIQGNTYLLR
jgi:hypothetical protein